MLYHAYSTYIQASDQAIRDQKPIEKAIKIPKAKKNWTKVEKIFTKICGKGHMISSPSHLNFTMYSLRAEEPQPIIKTHKAQNKPTCTLANTQIQGTASPKL